MEQVYDCIVIGGGPAGLSAAVNLRRRGRAPLVFSGGESLLAKAELVDNYLGLPGLTGHGLMDAFAAHARQQDVYKRQGYAAHVAPLAGSEGRNTAIVYKKQTALQGRSPRGERG